MRSKDEGLRQHARVSAVVERPLSQCKALVDPRLWPACIRQVRAVRVLQIRSSDSSGWSGVIEEVVDLTGLDLVLTRICCQLDVQVCLGTAPESARVDYQLRSDTSPLLTHNEGAIVLSQIEHGPRFYSTRIVIEKTVCFRPGAPAILRSRARYLGDMLRSWIHGAARELSSCPSA